MRGYGLTPGDKLGHGYGDWEAERRIVSTICHMRIEFQYAGDVRSEARVLVTPVDFIHVHSQEESWLPALVQQKTPILHRFVGLTHH